MTRIEILAFLLGIAVMAAGCSGSSANTFAAKEAEPSSESGDASKRQSQAPNTGEGEGNIDHPAMVAGTALTCSYDRQSAEQVENAYALGCGLVAEDGGLVPADPKLNVFFTAVYERLGVEFVRVVVAFPVTNSPRWTWAIPMDWLPNDSNLVSVSADISANNTDVGVTKSTPVASDNKEVERNPAVTPAVRNGLDNGSDMATGSYLELRNLVVGEDFDPDDATDCKGLTLRDIKPMELTDANTEYAGSSFKIRINIDDLPAKSGGTLGLDIYGVCGSDVVGAGAGNEDSMNVGLTDVSVVGGVSRNPVAIYNSGYDSGELRTGQKISFHVDKAGSYMIKIKAGKTGSGRKKTYDFAAIARIDLRFVSDQGRFGQVTVVSIDHSQDVQKGNVLVTDIPHFHTVTPTGQPATFQRGPALALSPTGLAASSR